MLNTMDSGLEVVREDDGDDDREDDGVLALVPLEHLVEGQQQLAVPLQVTLQLTQPHRTLHTQWGIKFKNRGEKWRQKIGKIKNY